MFNFFECLFPKKTTDHIHQKSQSLGITIQGLGFPSHEELAFFNGFRVPTEQELLSVSDDETPVETHIQVTSSTELVVSLPNSTLSLLSLWRERISSAPLARSSPCSDLVPCKWQSNSENFLMKKIPRFDSSFLLDLVPETTDRNIMIKYRQVTSSNKLTLSLIDSSLPLSRELISSPPLARWSPCSELVPYKLQSNNGHALMKKIPVFCNSFLSDFVLGTTDRNKMIKYKQTISNNELTLFAPRSLIESSLPISREWISSTPLARCSPCSELVPYKWPFNNGHSLMKMIPHFNSRVLSDFVLETTDRNRMINDKQRELTLLSWAKLLRCISVSYPRKLRSERRCTRELDDVLYKTVLVYAELQEKYIGSVVSKHRSFMLNGKPLDLAKLVLTAEKLVRLRESASLAELGKSHRQIEEARKTSRCFSRKL